MNESMKPKRPKIEIERPISPKNIIREIIVFIILETLLLIQIFL